MIKKGLGFEEGKVCSTSSKIFVKSISPPINSEIDTQDIFPHPNKEINKLQKIVSRSNMSKFPSLGKVASNNIPFKTRAQTKNNYQPQFLPKQNFQQPKQFYQNRRNRQEFNSSKFRVNNFQKSNHSRNNR